MVISLEAIKAVPFVPHAIRLNLRSNAANIKCDHIIKPLPFGKAVGTGTKEGCMLDEGCQAEV